MAFWSADLTTQDGAESAAGIGAYACFVAAVLSVAQIVMTVMSTLSIPGASVASSIGVVIVVIVSVALPELIIYVVAGMRLRAGRGVVWGTVAAVALFLRIVMRLVMLTQLPSIIAAPSFIIALVVTGVLLIAVITGVRGAMAIKRIGQEPDVAAMFE